MTLDLVRVLQSVGAEILDVRDPAEFAAPHLDGSIKYRPLDGWLCGCAASALIVVF